MKIFSKSLINTLTIKGKVILLYDFKNKYKCIVMENNQIISIDYSDKKHYKDINDYVFQIKNKFEI